MVLKKIIINSGKNNYNERWFYSENIYLFKGFFERDRVFRITA